MISELNPERSVATSAQSELLSLVKQKTMKLKITGKELRAIGFPEGPLISVAMNVMQKNYKHQKKEEVMELLKQILANPVEYMNDGVLALIAEKLIVKEETEIPPSEGLREAAIHFNVFGQEHIEEGAMHQMYQAAKLPVSVAGALMPDAHSGYGLPIGGVLATENAVIPYGVGVDIGCRMCLSLFDINPKELVDKEAYFAREINEATLFGSGRQFDHAANHEVMENELFFQLPLLKKMHGRVWKQLGSSGSGNHFAEFGVVEIAEKDAVLGIDAGVYVGFLTHSGSRALGANIANHYTTENFLHSYKTLSRLILNRPDEASREGREDRKGWENSAAFCSTLRRTVPGGKFPEANICFPSRQIGRASCRERV